MLWEQPRSDYLSPGRRPRPPPAGRWSGAALGPSRRCAAAAGPRTRALTASSRAPLTRRGARFVATGTSMRVAERAGGRGPTVRVPGIAAAAAAAAATLAGARRSRGAQRHGRGPRSRIGWRLRRAASGPEMPQGGFLFFRRSGPGLAGTHGLTTRWTDSGGRAKTTKRAKTAKRTRGM